MRVSRTLPTTSHPASADQWRLSPAAVEQMVEQLNAKKPKIVENFQAEKVVGCVIGSRMVDGEPIVDVDLQEPFASGLG